MAVWALSKVIGTGTSADPYRAAAGAYGSHLALIVSNDDGTPRFDWCLVRAGSGFDSVAADADPDVRVLGNVTMGHVLTQAEADALNAKAAHFGITAQAQAGMTVRQILRWLADRLDVTWDPEKVAVL